MRSKIRSAIVGASPKDGSSSSRRRGADAMPRPIASICCSPPDNVPASWLRRTCKLAATLGEHSKQLVDTVEVALPLGPAAERVGTHFEVFEHGHRGEDLPPLRRMGNAEMRALRRRYCEEVPVFEGDLAGTRLDRPRDRLE
jgi:hypothetical protein